MRPWVSGGSLMRYAARGVGDGQEADVVAETFAVAWQHLDQLRDEDALTALGNQGVGVASVGVAPARFEREIESRAR
jgi:hypothetical protein